MSIKGTDDPLAKLCQQILAPLRSNLWSIPTYMSVKRDKGLFFVPALCAKVLTLP